MTMDLQSLVDALLAKGDAEDAKKYGQMTLGGLMDVLSVLPPSMPVKFDDGTAPGSFRSYRGVYSQLALSARGDAPTVALLLKECQRANGSVMEGYKGGDFTMTRGTWLNRAAYGCCGDKIVGAAVADDLLVISTAAEDDTP